MDILTLLKCIDCVISLICIYFGFISKARYIFYCARCNDVCVMILKSIYNSRRTTVDDIFEVEYLMRRYNVRYSGDTGRIGMNVNAKLKGSINDDSNVTRLTIQTGNDVRMDDGNVCDTTTQITTTVESTTERPVGIGFQYF